MSNNELTPQQETALELLLSGNSTVRVCQELSIDRVTLYRWRQNERFATAYAEARRAISERTRELLSLAASRAVRRLVELMENDAQIEVPASVQYAAARSILDLHFKGIELEDVQESVDELRRLLGESQPMKRGLKAI
jgi:DNA invertase Pin-like site-specific DNA recombinase